MQREKQRTFKQVLSQTDFNTEVQADQPSQNMKGSIKPRLNYFYCDQKQEKLLNGTKTNM